MRGWHKTTAIGQRFWDFVKRGALDECWEWQAAIMPRGYGQLEFEDKHTYAHRVAWILTYGEIPEGLKVLHRCDNPPCCNPCHLFLGTSKDNSLDASSKGRIAHGARHGQSKLNDDSVREIRRLYDSGVAQVEIGRVLGISSNTLWHVVHRRTWRHVDA
jgi:HNH endonuclease